MEATTNARAKTSRMIPVLDIGPTQDDSDPPIGIVKL
jgi:hypothetical protein